jgi:eukaryotic-like serine/threonine-protein kinase
MADTGQRVGEYEVIAQLGAGGMGRVYKVRNVISNREEAMKILLPDFASDPDLGARFMAEIRTLAGLEHPGITQLRTAFQHNNQFVMVMEFVEGTTLEKLASEVRLPLDHILDYSMQVLAALSYAHGKGVTHRDIKPANIMITTHGVVKLMDFGIAKSSGDMQLTRPGSTMGSVYYMSPEQVSGGTVDGRSDLYSFGVTLYEMLTGRKPFVADTSYSVLNAQMNEAPKPPVELNPAIPLELNRIVLRAMAKRPEDRFQTAEEFRTDLRAVIEAPTAAIAQAAAPAMRDSAPVQAAASGWQSTSPQGEGPATAAGVPAFTPVPPVSLSPPVASAGPRRGLWIGLGAVTAVAALIAVASLLPRILSTHASPKPPAVSTDTPAVTPASSPQPQSPQSDSSQAGAGPAADSSLTPAATPAATPSTPATTSPTSTPGGTASNPGATNPGPTGSGGSSHAQVGTTPKPRQAYGPRPSTTPTAVPASVPEPQPATPSGPSPREMREAHDRFANLEARADAALAGVEQIRSEQRAQGVDIRGDILVAMNRLHHQLDQARQGLAAHDLETANEYMNRADNETARLEKFLGR